MTIGQDYVALKQRVAELEREKREAEAAFSEAAEEGGRLEREAGRQTKRATDAEQALAEAEERHRLHVQSLERNVETFRRERDDARMARDGWATQAANEKAVRERAEADNAALLSLLRDIVDWQNVEHEDEGCPEDDTCECSLIHRVNDALTPLHPHPGAALLEELRALRKVREALQPFHEMAGALVCMRIDASDDAPVRRTPFSSDHAHVLTMGHCRALVDALAADALRGKA